MGALFVAWTVVFTVHSNIELAAVVLLVLFVAAVVGSTTGPGTRRVPGTGSSSARGSGWLLWHTAGAVVGDGLFHEARVRKLVELGDLHLRTVDEFRDGGLHPGYAFPLWHGLDALVAWLSGLDPSVGDAARAVAARADRGRRRLRGGRRRLPLARAAASTVALAQVALFCFAPGDGGSYAQLAQPANAARQLLAPAAIALFFARATADAATVVVVRRARARPPDLRALHARAARGSSSPYREWRAYLGCGRTRRRRAALAAAARERDARARPQRRRAAARPAAVRRPARRLRPAPLPARAGGARPDRRRRDRGARPAAVDRARRPPALGARSCSAARCSSSC